jgi:hypothetical protein
MGASRRASRGWHRPSNSSSERLQLRSISSMTHSTDTLAADTPAGDRVFLAFSAAPSSFSLTRTDCGEDGSARLLLSDRPLG